MSVFFYFLNKYYTVFDICEHSQIKCMTKMENFCWIQESGTYSEGMVLADYKNTHFVKIGGKLVGDDSFSCGISRIYA